jgi:hypothetical protein
MSVACHGVGPRAESQEQAPLQAVPPPARRAVGQRGLQGVGSRRAEFWCMGFGRTIVRHVVGRILRPGGVALPRHWCMDSCMRAGSPPAGGVGHRPWRPLRVPHLRDRLSPWRERLRLGAQRGAVVRRR